MNTRIVTAIAALALSGASLAYADHRPDGDYDGGRYDGSRQSDYDTARVVHVEPLSRRIRVLEPRRECWLETVYDGGYYRGSHSPNSLIIGALIGGTLGNQVGHGDGRQIATVAGAAIGAAVGHDMAHRGPDAHYGDEHGRSREVERCRLTQQERFEERIDGYRVTYVFNGREYTTRMNYDPGPQLRVRVHVSPEQGY